MYRSIPVIYRKEKETEEYSEEQENVLRSIGQWKQDTEYETEITQMYFDPDQYRLQVHEDFDDRSRTVVQFCNEDGNPTVRAICVLGIKETVAILFGIYDTGTTSV